LIGTPPHHQLPLLPGEYDWLRERGWLKNFKKHEHRVTTYEFSGRRIHSETLVSLESGCPCSHSTRTTICRLYPVLPQFEHTGQITGIDLEFGSFEVLENLQGLERACRIAEVPLSEINKLLSICNAIARDPLTLFYVQAYSATKDHVRNRLHSIVSVGGDFFASYESALIRKRLIEKSQLDAELTAIALRFEAHYGTAFTLT
jgi:hypothetical protein